MRMKKFTVLAMVLLASFGLKADPSVIDQLPIDGIIYSLTDDYKAMVMGAMAFEEATGDERYEGDIVIPETVKYEGHDFTVNYVYVAAFCDCPELTSLILPATMEKVCSYFLANSPKLAYFECKATKVPEADADAFVDVVEGLVPVVPESALEAYKADPVWGQFWNTTAVENIQSDKQTTKFLQEGQVLIHRADHVFDAQGKMVK